MTVELLRFTFKLLRAGGGADLRVYRMGVNNAMLRRHWTSNVHVAAPEIAPAFWDHILCFWVESCRICTRTFLTASPVPRASPMANESLLSKVRHFGGQVAPAMALFGDFSQTRWRQVLQEGEMVEVSCSLVPSSVVLHWRRAWTIEK